MPTKTKTPRTGRPATRPADCRECPVYLAPGELAVIDGIARDAGLSRAEWLRRTVLAVAKLPTIYRQGK